MFDQDEEDTGPGPEVDMLNQLTGKPVAEDELLFAIPVVAPYNTLINYKWEYWKFKNQWWSLYNAILIQCFHRFKVKLTPGTGRRGKAAKTAVAVFLKERDITAREKDLLKAVKEEIIARNLPGKVKISTSQIQKVKK